MNQSKAGGVAGVRRPGSITRPRSAWHRCGYKPFLRRHPSRHTSGIRSTPSSATTPHKAALRNRKYRASESGEDREIVRPYFKEFLKLLQAISQELKQPNHVLMPHKHRKAV